MKTRRNLIISIFNSRLKLSDISLGQIPEATIILNRLPTNMLAEEQFKWSKLENAFMEELIKYVDEGLRK